MRWLLLELLRKISTLAVATSAAIGAGKGFPHTKPKKGASYPTAWQTEAYLNAGRVELG